MERNGSWQVASLPHQIVVSRITGSFSKKSVENYCLTVKHEVDKFHGKPWVHVCDARDFELGVPEAQAIAQQANEWAIKSGRIMRLYCTNNALQQHLLSKVTTSPTHYFNNIEDIFDYLEQHQYKIERSTMRHWFKLAELK